MLKDRTASYANLNFNRWEKWVMRGAASFTLAVGIQAGIRPPTVEAQLGPTPTPGSVARENTPVLWMTL